MLVRCQLRGQAIDPRDGRVTDYQHMGCGVCRVVARIRRGRDSSGAMWLRPHIAERSVAPLRRPGGRCGDQSARAYVPSNTVFQVSPPS